MYCPSPLYTFFAESTFQEITDNKVRLTSIGISDRKGFFVLLIIFRKRFGRPWCSATLVQWTPCTLDMARPWMDCYLKKIYFGFDFLLSRIFSIALGCIKITQEKSTKKMNHRKGRSLVKEKFGPMRIWFENWKEEEFKSLLQREKVNDILMCGLMK